MTSSVTMLPSSSRTIWYGEDRPSKLFTATTWQSRWTLMHQNESNDTYDFSVGTLSIWKFSLCTSLTLFISWLKTLHVLSGDLLNYQILSWLISMFCQLYIRYLCHITEECNNNIYNTSKHTFLCKLFKCLSRHHVLLTLDSAHSEYHGSATRKTLRDMANHDNYQAQIIRYHKTMKNITNKYKICIPYVHLHAAARCQLYKFT